MECSTISIDLDSYCSTISVAMRKARKNHKCGECHRIICHGEKYKYYVGVFDEIFVHKTCIDCISIRDEFFRDGYHYGMIIENLCEHISECGGDISERSIANLTERARDFVCDQIQEEWDDDNDV